MQPSRPQPTQQVIADLNDFDPRSGSSVERSVFNHRPWILAACVS